MEPAWRRQGTGRTGLHAAARLLVEVVEKRQGFKIACIEEIALRQGFIDEKGFDRLISKWASSSYGQYLQQVKQEFFQT